MTRAAGLLGVFELDGADGLTAQPNGVQRATKTLDALRGVVILDLGHWND
jgi:hypothetical protein